MFVWVPADNAEVGNVATPELSALVASELVPSLNVTLPVGVGPLPLAVAVNVTDWPNTVGFVSEVSAVMEEALLTVTAVLVLLASAAAASVAVMVWDAPTVLKVKLDSVPVPVFKVMFPAVPPLSSAMVAAPSELVIVTFVP